ncbi:MAG: tryptophan synthase subunit beta, partial [Candidatus Thiodiazotropha endolucinida]
METTEKIIGSLPDHKGHFGPYGGLFVSETLMAPLEELRQAYHRFMNDPEFLEELDQDLA